MFNLTQFRILHLSNIYDRLIKEGSNREGIIFIRNLIVELFNGPEDIGGLRMVKKVRRALAGVGNV